MSNVAIFLDYDNIFIMLEKYYGGKIDYSVEIIKKIKERFDKDKILTLKAFCDFQKISPVLTELQKNQVELRHVYSTGKGENRKNASDIALAIDVIKNVYNKENVDTYVLASCDSDMIPLVSELSYRGKDVVVIYSKIGTKQEYKTYLDEWKVSNYTIEELLGISEYIEITDAEIKENLKVILEHINTGIKLTYNKFGKGTSSKKDISFSLKRIGKYSKNDISIIIDKLLQWGYLQEIQITDKVDSKSVLLNNEFIENESIKLSEKIITAEDYA